MAIPFSDIFAAENKVSIYFFWGDGCPHCAKEEIFLKSLAQKYPNIEVKSYEVWHNSENQKILKEIGKKLKINISGVPFTVIGEKYIVGYIDDSTTGKEIEKLTEYYSQNTCPDIVKECLPQTEISPGISTTQSPIPEKIKLPFFGEVQIKNLSLPLLTLVLGTLDGFNPCAMWILVFLITLLLGTKSRKKMAILGGGFIFAEGLVYFLFMASWLNIMLFLRFAAWIRIVIGIVALVSGYYSLKEYREKKAGVCNVTNESKRKKIADKLKNLVHEKSFWLALIGVVVLASAINLIELLCSLGLPVIYTQVLTLSNLSAFQYYLYLFFYIFLYMLDDIIIFALAFAFFKTASVNTKYSQFSRLIGGIIMIIIGLLLLFKPEWLMFG